MTEIGKSSRTSCGLSRAELSHHRQRHDQASHRPLPERRPAYRGNGGGLIDAPSRKHQPDSLIWSFLQIFFENGKFLALKFEYIKMGSQIDSVTLTIHRAANEIGGNCIEIAAKGERILLDAGRPLDASEDEACSLVPRTLDLVRPVAGVLLSHPHQDHYGLLDELPASWPVYCGKAAESLIRLTSGIFEKAPPQQFRNWESGILARLGALPNHPVSHRSFRFRRVHAAR